METMTVDEISLNIAKRIEELSAMYNELTDGHHRRTVKYAIATFTDALTEFDSLHILKLTVRCYNTLCRANVNTVTKLRNIDSEQLSKINGITNTMIEEIRFKLQ